MLEYFKTIYMKIITVLVCFCLLSFSTLSGIYDVELQTIEGKTIALATFKGSKMLIAEFNAAAPDKSFLSDLETVKKAYKNLQIIAVPATDFDGAANIQSLLQLKADLNLSYEITLPAGVKKNGTSNQSPLFRWLTHDSENRHFNIDIENEGQLFFISEKGTLYAVSGRKMPLAQIKEAAGQSTKE